MSTDVLDRNFESKAMCSITILVFDVSTKSEPALFFKTSSIFLFGLIVSYFRDFTSVTDATNRVNGIAGSFFLFWPTKPFGL